ncbi:MAG TPA: oxidoreductase [Rhodanobacteraceae bacterium]|nr:oxidoreductase [Rhodanobacteraceae bacterium]
MSRIYLITGTSSGFGRALAEAVLERGDCAVLTARNPGTVSDIAGRYDHRAIAVRLDVTNEEERRSAVDAAVKHFGRIDVLVNNAGQGSLGAAEEFSSTQIRKLMEVNFFGAIEMTRAVLPIMRKQGSGHILNISSIGGRVNIGGFALYGAAKFALEGFSEALRDEVAPLGVRVTLVEPGAFRTEFAGDSNMRPETIIEDYRPVVDPVREYLYGNNGKQPGDPRKAALAMIQAVEAARPPLRLLLGADAYKLLEVKNREMADELAAWRSVGEATAFDDAEMRDIGG